MFDLNAIEAIEAVLPHSQREPVMTKEAVSIGLMNEAVQRLAGMAQDPEKDQRVFNITVAKQMDGTDDKAGALMARIVQTLQRLNGARQTGNTDTEQQAQQALEFTCNFLSTLAGGIVRSGFFLHRSAEQAEEQARTKNNGDAMPLSLRMQYPGWRGRIVEPDAVEDAVDELTENLRQMHGKLLSYTSPYYRANRSEFYVGGEQQSNGEYVNYLEFREFWKILRNAADESAANRLSGARAAAFCSPIPPVDPQDLPSNQPRKGARASAAKSAK